jgi:hypothetical protein
MNMLPAILNGTPAQIEWAERIIPSVNNEFDRVAHALTGAMTGKTDRVRADTDLVIAILEEKRAEVMAHVEAGYFIHHWQELNDQVRTMIGSDPRYQAIKAEKRLSRVKQG